MFKLKLGLMEKLLYKSLRASNQQRNEEKLKLELIHIIPDLTHQYTTVLVDMQNAYMTEKYRCQHAFQIQLTLKAVELWQNLKNTKILNIVDIGDSAGTHIKYLKNILSRQNINVRTLSVNLDPQAIKKIRSLGLEAIQSRAEDLHNKKNGVKVDIFLSFQMLEHLTNPIGFLRSMSLNAKSDFFVITVPYLIKSRVGLYHLREGGNREVVAENTHVFELSPEDWDLIFRFSGWKIIYSDKYTQYPKNHFLSLTKYFWRKYDFDGFYGVILERNHAEMDLYKSWD